MLAYSLEEAADVLSAIEVPSVWEVRGCAPVDLLVEAVENRLDVPARESLVDAPHYFL
jgi:hypothetical protein